jgi:multidrug efflux pump subunit AcrA (membrane-fusion protein)
MKWKLAVSLAALAATAAALQSSTGGMANLSPGVALAAPTPRGRLVAAAGLVEPASEARQLEATMVGRLVTLNREEGDHVAAGEVIAEIENADLKAQLAESEAALSVRENELTRLIKQDQIMSGRALWGRKNLSRTWLSSRQSRRAIRRLLAVLSPQHNYPC